MTKAREKELWIAMREYIKGAPKTVDLFLCNITHHITTKEQERREIRFRIYKRGFKFKGTLWTNRTWQSLRDCGAALWEPTDRKSRLAFLTEQIDKL